jgi:hypothetical protein
MENRKGDWIETVSHQQFWPLDPRPEDIHLDDIIHSLSMQVRFTGHTFEPYTIAQHSVLVADRAKEISGITNPTKTEMVYLWALLHDATEAYLVDVPRPIKGFLTNYKKIEDRLMENICIRFNLPIKMPPEIKQADHDLLVTEAAYYFPIKRRPDRWSEKGELLNINVKAWSHRVAGIMFKGALYKAFAEYSI